MTDNLIAMTRVEKNYGQKPILSPFDFSLIAGERVQVVGANGSGKSTFLRLLAGVARPTSGQVQRGTGVSVGYVPQSGGLLEELTLRHNANLIASNSAGDGGSLSDHSEWLGTFGLTDYLDRPVAIMSGGMKRIAVFLCVWASRPSVVIADEPLAGIDPTRAEKLEELVTSGAGSKQAYVFSAHALAGPGRVVTVADRGIN